MLRVFPCGLVCLAVGVCVSVRFLGVVWLPAVRYQNRRLEDESAPKPLLESEVDMVSILFFFVSPKFHPAFYICLLRRRARLCGCRSNMLPHKGA